MHHNLCKNCEHTFEGNFCSNCGQKTNTVRLNWHFVQDELKYTFLHINKGLLYTIKELFIRPGDTIREFIEGKRVKHYKPILFVFVLAGLEGLLNHYLPLEKIFKNLSATKVDKINGFMPKIFDWITGHNAIIELMLLPIISLCSWIAFKKWGYNYIENIIINCFATGQRLAVSILLFPIMYFSNPNYFIFINSFIGFISYAFTIWTFYSLYKKHNLGDFIVKMLLFLVLIAITLTVFFFTFGILVVTYLVKSGQLKL
jgi:hypothetical protein